MVHHVACIGAGFVGGPLGIVIAYHCPQLRITVADVNESRIHGWAKGEPCFYEPGLQKVLSAVQSRSASTQNLEFVTDVEAAIQQADLIFLCVDTPTKSFGVGQGYAVDITNTLRVARTIARVASGRKIIVEKSTIPCGTVEKLQDVLNGAFTADFEFEILSNPEFLSEGNAIEDLMAPSRILIGSALTASGKQAADQLANIYTHWVPRASILRMDTWSSELSKLAANAMLAQRISSINSLSAICEVVGGTANIDSVSEACGRDRRIGPHMLRGGLGWGGGCFEKDIRNLVYIARSLHLNEVASYWESVILMNQSQQTRFVRRIITCMHGNIVGCSIAILGFAFKENTSDTKNSPAIPVVQALLSEGAKVSIYDPMVSSHDIEAAIETTDSRRFQICPSPYKACCLADAVVLVTGWDQFRTPVTTNHVLTPEESHGLDWTRIVNTMSHPKYVFDGRNLLDGEFLTRLGCRYVRVGRSSSWD